MAKHVKTIEDIASKVFNIWADGSFAKKSALIGVGYLICDEKNNELIQRGRSFERFPNDSSTIAELLSCTAALSELPEGCTITLHSDCQFVIDAFNDNKFSHKKEGINTALKALFNEASRHNNIRAVLTHEGQSHYLKQAHNMSVSARKHKIQP